MKINWTKLAVAMAAVGALTVSTAAYANPVPVGSISFGGAYTVPNPDLTTAEAATITSVVVITSGGVLSGATLPTFATPIGINGAGPSLVNQTLWTVVAGGITWSFTVNTESVDGSSTSSSSGLKGIGTLTDISDNIYATSSGIWQIGFGQAGSFSWQSTSSTVPDGGATVMLLGAALTGMGLLRRKLIA